MFGKQPPSSYAGYTGRAASSPSPSGYQQLSVASGFTLKPRDAVGAPQQAPAASSSLSAYGSQRTDPRAAPAAKKTSNESWKCSCGFANYPNRAWCFQCNAPRGTGGSGTGGGGGTGASGGGLAPTTPTIGEQQRTSGFTKTGSSSHLPRAATSPTVTPYAGSYTPQQLQPQQQQQQQQQNQSLTPVYGRGATTATAGVTSTGTPSYGNYTTTTPSSTASFTASQNRSSASTHIASSPAASYPATSYTATSYTAKPVVVPSRGTNYTTPTAPPTRHIYQQQQQQPQQRPPAQQQQHQLQQQQQQPQQRHQYQQQQPQQQQRQQAPQQQRQPAPQQQQHHQQQQQQRPQQQQQQLQQLRTPAQHVQPRPQQQQQQQRHQQHAPHQERAAQYPPPRGASTGASTHTQSPMTPHQYVQQQHPTTSSSLTSHRGPPPRNPVTLSRPTPAVDPTKVSLLHNTRPASRPISPAPTAATTGGLNLFGTTPKRPNSSTTYSITSNNSNRRTVTATPTAGASQGYTLEAPTQKPKQAQPRSSPVVPPPARVTAPQPFRRRDLPVPPVQQEGKHKVTYNVTKQPKTPQHPQTTLSPTKTPSGPPPLKQQKLNPPAAAAQQQSQPKMPQKEMQVATPAVPKVKTYTDWVQYIRSLDVTPFTDTERTPTQLEHTLATKVPLDFQLCKTAWCLHGLFSAPPQSPPTVEQSDEPLIKQTDPKITDQPPNTVIVRTLLCANKSARSVILMGKPDIIHGVCPGGVVSGIDDDEPQTNALETAASQFCEEQLGVDIPADELIILADFRYSQQRRVVYFIPVGVLHWNSTSAVRPIQHDREETIPVKEHEEVELTEEEKTEAQKKFEDEIQQLQESATTSNNPNEREADKIERVATLEEKIATKKRNWKVPTTKTVEKTVHKTRTVTEILYRPKFVAVQVLNFERQNLSGWEQKNNFELRVCSLLLEYAESRFYGHQVLEWLLAREEAREVVEGETAEMTKKVVEAQTEWDKYKKAKLAVVQKREERSRKRAREDRELNTLPEARKEEKALIYQEERAKEDADATLEDPEEPSRKRMKIEQEHDDDALRVWKYFDSNNSGQVEVGKFMSSLLGLGEYFSLQQLRDMTKEMNPMEAKTWKYTSHCTLKKLVEVEPVE